jgi:hypothetical protein
VVPVLLLALAFESRALDRIKNRSRQDEEQIKLFKSWVVRVLGIVMCLAAAWAEVVALLVLNDTIGTGIAVEVSVLAGTFVLLAIVLGRVLIDVVEATSAKRFTSDA